MIVLNNVSKWYHLYMYIRSSTSSMYQVTSNVIHAVLHISFHIYNYAISSYISCSVCTYGLISYMYIFDVHELINQCCTCPIHIHTCTYMYLYSVFIILEFFSVTQYSSSPVQDKVKLLIANVKLPRVVMW